MQVAPKRWNRPLTARERRITFLWAGIVSLGAVLVWALLAGQIGWHVTAGIRAVLFAWPRTRTFAGQLRLQVPLGWSCESSRCVRYTILGVEQASITFVAREGAPLGKHLPPAIPFIVGGEPAKLQAYSGQFTIAQITVPSKRVFMEFSGTAEDWRQWERALKSAIWLPQ